MNFFVCYLDPELGDCSLHLPKPGPLAVDGPHALAIPVNLPEDDDVVLLRVEELHLDGGPVLAHSDEVHDAGGSAEDVWFPSETEADPVDDARFPSTVRTLDSKELLLRTRHKQVS